MKSILTSLLLALIVCLQCANAKSPDPSESGSHSSMFSYVLTFEPASKTETAHFKATLTNITNSHLQVNVNDKAFHSTLEISGEGEDKFEAFITRYRTLLMTSTWFEPMITINSKKSISWKVPLSSLLTLHGKPVTHSSLAKKKVVSEMVMAVMPKTGKSISDNAVQRSKSILIPAITSK